MPRLGMDWACVVSHRRWLLLGFSSRFLEPYTHAFTVYKIALGHQIRIAIKGTHYVDVQGESQPTNLHRTISIVPIILFHLCVAG